MGAVGEKINSTISMTICGNCAIKNVENNRSIIMTELEARKEAMLAFLKKNTFISYFDLEIVELGPDKTVGRIPFAEKLLNPYGTAHGGCLYAIADTVGGTLANMNGRLVTTVNGSMNYLEPACDTEYIYCEAKLVRCGKHLITVDIVLHGDDGKVFDTAAFTYFRSEQELTAEVN